MRPAAEEHCEAPASVSIQRRVEWIDTDAAGIAHWLACLRLVEVAEWALHTALGIDEETIGALPRLAVSIDYRGPLRFNDLAIVDLRVQTVGNSSLAYAFSVSGPSGLAAEGELTTCLVSASDGRPRPWPDALRTPLMAGGPQLAGPGR